VSQAIVILRREKDNCSVLGLINPPRTVHVDGDKRKGCFQDLLTFMVT
jgi:hypothetical protein